MAPPRMHLPGPLRPGPVRLSSAQARRLLGSRRLREGSEFLAFSGDGQEWSARVASARRRDAVAELLEVVRREPPPSPVVEVFCALVRPSRFDWMVEKCVEAGADVIRPLICENGARGYRPSGARLERWQRLALEAAEQCGRLHLPVVGHPALLPAVLGGGAWTIVCHPDGEAWPLAASRAGSEGTVRIVVGPEGGLTGGELARARAAGASVVRLGPNVMRTETAAVAATVLVRAAAISSRTPPHP